MFIGVGLGLTRASVPAYPFVNPEAAALVARMTVQPDSTRKGLIDNLFTALKSIGLSKFDVFYVFAAHSQQAANLNWIGTTFTASPQNAPTFTTDRGYTGDGSTSYIDTGFNPTTATSPKFVQNSGHLGLWSRTAGQSGAVDAGNANTLILCRSTGDTSSFRINTGTSGVAGSVTDGSGHFLTSRTGALSTDNVLYRNGASTGTSSAASAAPDNSNIRFLGRGGTLAFSSRQQSAAHLGAGLTSANASTLYSAVQTYLQAVGAA